MKIKAVLFNFIGAIVKEKDSSLIINCLSRAFADHGFCFNDQFFISKNEKDKLAIINDVSNQFKLPLSIADSIYGSFKKNIKGNSGNFSSFDDSLITVSHLSRRGILTGIVSELPREIFEIIFTHLGWTKRAFNYIGFYNELGKRAEGSGVIFDMMSLFKIESPREILSVSGMGDDIIDRRNTGCLTAVVLPGTEAKGDLIHQNPDFILRSLSDLRMMI